MNENSDEKNGDGDGGGRERGGEVEDVLNPSTIERINIGHTKFMSDGERDEGEREDRELEDVEEEEEEGD